MNRRLLLKGLAALPWMKWSSRLDAAAPKGSISDDFAVFRAAMSIHPGLYRYASPKMVEQRLQEFERAYRAGFSVESRERCYLAVSAFLATVRCGHSYCNFFNQSDVAVTALFSRATRLPFFFEWVDHEMVVTGDHTGTNALPRGTRVKSINGMPSARVCDLLMPYTRGDGHNDGKRRSLLGVRGAETIEYFDVFQGLLLPPAGGVHHLEVVRPLGGASMVEVSAIGLAARQSATTRVPEESDKPRWTWTMRPDGIAVLDMPGWAMWNSRWPWKNWLEERLDSLRGARGLLIDIRGNEGGEDCGNPILARLITHDLQGWNFEERLRFRKVPEILSPHISTWDDSFRRVGEGARAIGDGFYVRPGFTGATPVRPAEQRLHIPVAALIGPANSSATFGFINAAKESRRIKLFGEQTGGNQRGINGGAFFFTKLPGSGIEFDLPLIGYFPRTQEPDAGLAPDVKVARTAEDVAKGLDPAMSAAIGWIARS